MIRPYYEFLAGSEVDWQSIETQMGQASGTTDYCLWDYVRYVQDWVTGLVTLDSESGLWAMPVPPLPTVENVRRWNDLYDKYDIDQKGVA